MCKVASLKVKISDFGLTREGTVYQMDPHKRVPIRWLAPETLKMAIYTQKTDVFSYGKANHLKCNHKTVTFAHRYHVLGNLQQWNRTISRHDCGGS